jgi:hypothetical protein
MELKFAVFFVLGLVVLGLIIALSTPTIMGLMNSFSPRGEDSRTQDLITECNTKLSTYHISESEETRRNYCCESDDLNNNGVIEEGEYCATLQDAQITCKTPIDYYTSHEACGQP